MKSVRLGDALEGRLARAAAAANLPESEIIRQAVSRRVDEILGVTVYDLVKDLVVDTGVASGSTSEMTDAEIADELAHDAASHRREL